MAISYRPEKLGDYASSAADVAQQAFPSAFSPEVGLTSNAYGMIDPKTGIARPYSAQDIIQQGGGDPNKMINVPHGQNFMSQWGWTLPILSFLGAGLAGAAGSGAGGATEAGAGAGTGAGAGAGTGAVEGVGAGMSSADAAAAYGGAGGITTGNAALDTQMGFTGAGAGVGAGAASAMGMPSSSTGAAPVTGAPTAGAAQPGSAGAVGAQQAPAPVSTATPISAANAPGPAGVTTGTAQTPVSSGFKTGNAILDKTLGALNSKYAGLLLQGLGLGISAAAGKKGMPNEQQFQGMGDVASSAAIQNIQMAQAGQLSGPQQATLDQYTQEAKNQVRQYFSSIGQFDSTERIKAEQQVDQQALAMKQQLIQTTLQNGISLMGAANTPLAQVANYQLGQDQNLMNAIGRFTSGVGTTLGSQAGTQAKAA